MEGSETILNPHNVGCIPKIHKVTIFSYFIYTKWIIATWLPTKILLHFWFLI